MTRSTQLALSISAVISLYLASSPAAAHGHCPIEDPYSGWHPGSSYADSD